MILFEDMRKAPTLDLKKLLGDSVFNKIHLVGESNGYNIVNLYGSSPNMIVYPNSKQLYLLFKSISYTGSKELLQKNIIDYIDRATPETLKYYQSYVNRDIKYEFNYYKPMSVILTMCDSKWRFNKWGRVMYDNLPGTEYNNKIIISNLLGQIYDYLYDSNVVLKQPQSFEIYLWDILSKENIKNELFIFTPPSYLRGNLSFSQYELLMTVVDWIEKMGGYIIFVDDISFGKKYNLMLEVQAKLYNRKSSLIKYRHSETLVLTNLKICDIIDT